MDINFGAALVGGIQGQISSIFKNHFDAKKFKTEMKYKSVNDARSVTQKDFISMQKMLCFMTVFYVCVAPFIISFYHDIPIDFAYDESNGLLTWLMSHWSDVKWHKVNGLPIGPIHCYLVASVVFYLLGVNTRR